MDGVKMGFESDELKTADLGMKKILQLAENVASSRATILICGESGCGKEVLARYIHARSPRASRRLVAINCAAIPSELLESELFGYEKGAFTGAGQSKPGKFELANDSTFLLDEISEMPLLLQAKLLRVIQEGEVERLGAKAPVKVNVRLIATTNRDLPSMVREGRFREDLYYRLNVIPLQIPPLRERPRDVELLARFFIEVSSHINGKSVKPLSELALAKLGQWSWPGNVRELENVIERAILMSAGSEISPDDVAIEGFKPMVASEESFTPGMTISEAERRLIMKTLEYTGQNRTKAAQLLGISIRTLRNKLHEYGVAPAAATREELLNG
jgi:two-component system response regulator FlrC